MGIRLEWQFGLRKRVVLWLRCPNHCRDVGNRFEEGIVDTHSLDTYSSSTDAIFRNPHLVLKHLWDR